MTAGRTEDYNCKVAAVSLITGQDECFPWKNVSHFRVVLGLFYILEWRYFCRKRLEVYLLDTKGLTNIVNNQPNKKHLPLTRENGFSWWRLGSNNNGNITHSLGWVLFCFVFFYIYWDITDKAINCTYCTFKVYDLISFDICIYPWSHHHNQYNKHTYQPKYFLWLLLLLSPDTFCHCTLI